jgi:uncharacterized protein YegJ (DUF2314 family)
MDLWLSGKVYGGYQNPQNTFRTVGYKWFETYRFGIRLYLKEGGVTETFWIDDIKFDIYLHECNHAE